MTSFMQAKLKKIPNTLKFHVISYKNLWNRIIVVPILTMKE
jgi:hypothetical protein